MTRYDIVHYMITQLKCPYYFKVLTFTADNASNNDTLVEELSDLLLSFGGKEYCVRCFAHVLNLIVKVCHHNLSSMLCRGIQITGSLGYLISVQSKAKETC